MFEGFKTTKAERDAIDRAFYAVEEICGHDFRCQRLAKDEARGYGNRNDAIPAIAARGLCAKWFLDGVNRPELRLADSYYMRPAAIFFTGSGAARGAIALAICHFATIHTGVAAYKAAFERMHARDKAALSQLQTN